MALGFRQVQTPNGMVLVPEDQAAAFGLAPVMQPDMGAPTLPQPAESPVPDVALAPPPPEDAGLTQIEPPPTAAPTPEAAPPAQAAPSPATQPIADAPQPAADAPPAEPAPSKPLSQTTYDDLATRYAQDTQAQISAAQKVGEAEAQQAAEVANAMQERDRIATAKIAEMEEKRAADEAAIKQKEQVWQAKQDEWMKAKVTRRGMSTGELVLAAIAGLGSALKGQGDQNPALGVIMSNIQRDVDDQIRERDELGKQAGALKGAVDYAREVASNAQAQRVAAYGLEMQRQAQMLETVAKRMEPGIKRANMEQTAATLGAQGTQLYGQALQAQHAEDAQKAAREQAERESRRSAYVAMRGQDLSYKTRLAEIEAESAARAAAAKSKQEQDYAKQEVADLQVRSGDQVAQYRAASEEDAKALRGVKAARDVINQGLIEAQQIRQKYPSFAAARNSADYQRLQSIYGNVGMAFSKLNAGGAYDSGMANLTKQVMGGDPLSGSFAQDAVAGLWKNTDPTAGLEQMRKQVNDKFNFEANARRDARAGEFVPLELERAIDDPRITTKRDEKVQTFLDTKTPQQVVDSAKPGPVIDVIQNTFGDAPTAEQRAAQAKYNARVDAATGLDKDQAATLKRWEKEARGGDPDVIAALEMARTGNAKAKAAIERVRAMNPEIVTASETALAARSDMASAALDPKAAKRPELRSAVLAALVRSGANAEIERIERELAAAGGPVKSEREGEARTQIVRDVKERVAQTSAPGVAEVKSGTVVMKSDVPSLLGLAQKGSPVARQKLEAMAYGPPSLEQIDALAALQKLNRSRK